MITKKEFKLLADHVTTDIYYREGGTFYKEDANSESHFDIKTADKVIEILTKIATAIGKGKQNAK